VMSRTEAWDYLNDRFYVDKLSHDVFEEYMRALMDVKHKPWCRTRLREAFPNYGSDCTCGEGIEDGV
jgi:hypothetical protein